MTRPTTSDFTLAPYQADFRDKYLASFRQGFTCLVSAPPGSGKTFIFAHVIADLVHGGRVDRVLLVTHSNALAEQWRYILARFKQDSKVIDGGAIRSFYEESPTDYASWPAGVFIISQEIATTSMAMPLLGAIPWGLLVFDDEASAASAVSLRKRLRRTATPPAELLATHQSRAVSTGSAPHDLPINWHASFASIERSQPPSEGTSLISEEIRLFHRSSAEQELEAEVAATARLLGGEPGVDLLTSASSSHAALEDCVARLADHTEWGPAPRAALTSVLGRLDELSVDSKVTATISILQSFTKSAHSSAIFCQCRATLDYVLAALDSEGHRAVAVHAELSAEECIEVVASHVRDGGALVIASESASIVSLSHVDAVIHFDLPSSSAAFARREGQYQRYGSARACKVAYLRDGTNSSALEGLQLRLVNRHHLGVSGTQIDVLALLREVPLEAPSEQ